MKSENEKDCLADSQVVDLAAFKKKREVAEELARGRSPLYVSHLTGKVTGGPQPDGSQAPDFGDRLQRIRSSLDKINRLMSELKRMSSSETEAAEHATSGQTQK